MFVIPVTSALCYVLGDKKYIKNVDMKSAPRWSKVQGGGGVKGALGKFQS